MKTILVPTDFSESAFNAALYAMDLAKSLQAKIHLLNIYHIPNPLKTLPVEIIITPDELKSDTESELKKTAALLQEIKPGSAEITLASRNGHSGEEIIAYAKFVHADLVIMGMRGAGIVKEKLIGSVATSVINHCPVPVLVVPGEASYHKVNNVIFASDGEDIHEQSHLNLLLEVIRTHDSRLNIVTILPKHGHDSRESIAERLDRSFMNVHHAYHFPQTNDISKGILDFVQSHHGDWLVMIPRKHTFLQTLFSESHTRQMAFHTHIPLLTLHD